MGHKNERKKLPGGKIAGRKIAGRKARIRRRKRRQRIVLIEKLVMAAAVIIVFAAVGVLCVKLAPEIRISRKLSAASTFMEKQDYEDAIASCEEALQIDSSSVQAYHAMAGVYLTKEDNVLAEQVLYKGWETTQDESLLQYYCTVLLNEAVEDINNQKCTLNTMEKCVEVLEENSENEDAFRLLDVCYEKLLQDTPEQTGLFCSDFSGSQEESCGYEQYQDLMLRMMKVYEASPSEELKAEIIKFAVPDTAKMLLEVKHLQDYCDLLVKAAQVESSEKLEQLIACMEKAVQVQDYFSQAFAVFESGDFSPVREFMNSSEYIAIRDEFIAGTMEYWKGETYIPVSREMMKIINEDGSFQFSFLDFEENPDTDGVISVWGMKQEDAGVQRICISYEPASENGEYYPHTTYEFVYLYSNVKIGGQYVPQMNYRFETRVATHEGTTTQLIGDWGGEHEWTTEF